MAEQIGYLLTETPDLSLAGLGRPPPLVVKVWNHATVS